MNRAFAGILQLIAKFFLFGSPQSFFRLRKGKSSLRPFPVAFVHRRIRFPLEIANHCAQLAG